MSPQVVGDYMQDDLYMRTGDGRGARENKEGTSDGRRRRVNLIGH